MINWQEIETPFGTSARIAFVSEDSVNISVRREDSPLIINKIPCIGQANFRLGSAGGVSFNDDAHWRLDTGAVWFRRKTQSHNDDMTDNMRAKLWKWLREEVPLWIHANKKVLPIEAQLTCLQSDACSLDGKINELIEQRKMLTVSITNTTKRLKKAKG